MSFLVAALAFLELLLEAAALILGIVQFTKAIGDLHLAGKNFPALGPLRFVQFLLRERRNSRREFVDDGWLRQMLFCGGLEKIGNRFSRWLVGIVRHVRMLGIEALHQLPDRIMACEIEHLRFCTSAFRPVM